MLTTDGNHLIILETMRIDRNLPKFQSKKSLKAVRSDESFDDEEGSSDDSDNASFTNNVLDKIAQTLGAGALGDLDTKSFAPQSV